MMHELSIEECEKLGVTYPAHRMENGERRFRCLKGTLGNGYGYILTELPDGSGGWQKSHFHKGIQETYIVQSGWIAFADMEGANLRIRIFRPGEIGTSTLREPHNIYMSGGAVVHVVKHGDTSVENDWFADTALDEHTLSLSEEDIRTRAV